MSSYLNKFRNTSSSNIYGATKNEELLRILIYSGFPSGGKRNFDSNVKALLV